MSKEAVPGFSQVYETYHGKVRGYVAKLIGPEEADDVTQEVFVKAEEIARRLSLSVGAVKIRLHRARSRLNEELRQNCQCYTNERGELMAAPKRR